MKNNIDDIENLIHQLRIMGFTHLDFKNMLDKASKLIAEQHLELLLLRAKGSKEKDSLIASEAIYGFGGWLTSRKELLIVSRQHKADAMADAIEEFIKVNNLNEPRIGWERVLIHPEEKVDK